MPTVWNPSDATAHWSFTNTHHTGSTISGAGNEGVRSIGATHAAGKWYVEYTNLTNTGASGQYGFAAAADTLGGSGQCGCNAGGSVNNVAGGSISLGATTAGHTLCFAIDLDNKRLWGRYGSGNWNNSGTANPSTNTGGVDLTGISAAALSLYAFQQFNPGSVTVNAGDSAFQQAIPAGFAAWDASIAFAFAQARVIA